MQVSIKNEENDVIESSRYFGISETTLEKALDDQ